MAEEFDPLRYIASYPDLIQAFGVNAEAGRQHWLTYGQAEGRNPFLFNPFIYGASHPDLIAAFGTNYAGYVTHYIQYGYAEGRATSSFDYLAYSASNQDLLVVYGTDATALARHYLEFGYSEGRSFNRFDPLIYAASNPDVAAAYGEDRAQILTHYINHGYYEHRATSGFDPIQYVAANEDLLLLGYQNYPQDALHHYLQTGADEGRPTDFDERAYLLSYADLAGNHLTEAGALEHWISTGVHEGRAGDTLFGHDQTTHALPVGSTAVAAIDFAGDRDWFELNLAQGTFHSLLTTNADGSVRPATITLHDQYGVPIASKNVQTGDVSGLDFTASYAGRYFVVVTSSQTGAYRLSDSENATGTMTIGGRNYTDADFAGVHGVRYLVLTDHYSVQLGPNAQAAGIRVVTATSNLASVIDASAYTAGLTVDVSAGGGDTVLTGSGNDHVIAGPGAQNFSLGSGDDLVTGAVSTSHTIEGGPGTDTIRVTGEVTLDLSKISGVERIEQGADKLNLHLTNSSPTADAHYTIVGNGNYEYSWISFDPTLTAANISFTIQAAPGGTLLNKANDVHNAIDFIGGAGPDVVILDLDQLGPDVTFDGGDGVDRYVLFGATTMTDAHFGSFSNMEILDQGVSNITLGDLAAASGLTRINLRGDVSKQVVFEPDFTGEVEIYLTRDVSSSFTAPVSNTVAHLIDASASPGRLIFTTDSTELQANDIVRGGTGSTDVLNINYLIYNTPFVGNPPVLPPFDLTNLTGVETINVTVVDPGRMRPMSNGPMILDTAPGDLDGTDTLTINVFQAIRGTPESKIYAAIDASAATVNLVVNGVSYLEAGSGNDTILAAQFVPTIIIGNAGDDSIIGSGKVDQISGGSGADVITGAGGPDQLSGGSESDTFRYTAFAESDGSNGGPNFDTISDFISGTDVIDVTSLQGEAYAGQVIDFVGNGANLAAAQALLTPRDATFDAVYQQNAHTLWFDNGDGVLDVHDLKIVLTGVASLTGADVLEGAVIIG